jgi:hypothetical protein
MNITQRCRQIALVTLLGVGSLGLEMSQADAFTLQETGAAQFEFFDITGTQVGGGSITYKPLTGNFLTGSTPFDPIVFEDASNPFPPPPGLFERRYYPPDGTYYLTSSSLTLLGFNVSRPSIPNLSDRQGVYGVDLWQPPDKETTIGAPLTRISAGAYPKISRLFPGLNWSDFASQQFQWYWINSNGTWRMFGKSSNGQSFDEGGTWRATAVPEPGTLVGSVMAAIALWRLKQRRGTKSDQLKLHQVEHPRP